ncbi:MAG: thioredoxin [Chlamydiales bacterium]|nr:thioredoxin [Chlamydiales bacterium]
MESTIKKVTDADFTKSIAKGLTLVDFYADWCGPCRMLAPIIEEVAAEMGGKLAVVKVNVDTEQATAAKFTITSIPTIILFKNGKEVARLVGLQDFDSLIELIEPHSQIN